MALALNSDTAAVALAYATANGATCQELYTDSVTMAPAIVNNTGIVKYLSNEDVFRLTANGSAISTIADFFGTNDGISMAAAGIYAIDWWCWLVQNTGAGTHTWTITLSAAATIASAQYIASPTGGIGTVGSPQTAGIINATSTTALPVTGSMSGPANHYCWVHAIIEASGAANARLRLTVSANNATPQKESYFTVKRLFTANVGTFVA